LTKEFLSLIKNIKNKLVKFKKHYIYNTTRNFILNCDLIILKKYNDNNKLTIFVGAGVSKSSNLPSWGDLINKIKTELSISNSETDYLKIAQLYYLSCGETVYYQRIKEFFPENVEPTIIQKLIFDLKPANIITTNWDILLEKTAQDYGYIYDVISKDEHLVQSQLENHIIKMHGDFNHNNIVFKEDDYINYQYIFPLIENYVKSILSTNAILFLGYSYSDINLKQIIKWIQNNSKIMPPMFLVVFEEDKNQSKYLENFGIKTIVITDEDKSFGLIDSYSNKLATFLTYLNSEEESLNDIENLTDLEVVDFVFNRLKPLDELNAILFKQIQSTLTNCGFSYQQLTYETGEIKNLVFLEFYDNLLTYDINKKIRKIYNKFREILNSYNEEYLNEIKEYNEEYSNEIKEKINNIASILCKANIDGYIKTNDKNSLHKRIKEFGFFTNGRQINQVEKELCNFEFNDFETNENNIEILMKKAFFYYQRYGFLKAYRLNEKIIKLCLKQQNYIHLFLAMFNHNILLMNLKQYLHNIGSDKEYKTADEAWQYKIRPYNLDEKFYELPKAIQKVLYEIKLFINYDYLYRFASEVEDELDKKEKQKKAIERNSGMTWDTNVTRNYSKQKNLIHFVINNFIMMEINCQFVTINKKLIKISLIRQMQRGYFTLDKMELFATIKYITHKDLIELISEFEDFKLKIDTKTLNWLTINILPNIVKLYNTNNDKILYFRFGNELENIFYICSLVKLNKRQSIVALEQVRILINSKKLNLNIYGQINNFIDNQKNIEKKDLINILEMMMDKIICNKANNWDYQVIENNYLWSPFEHLVNNSNTYTNISLIKKFLEKLKDFSTKQKILLSQGFLISLYNISNEEIKKLIKEFMLDIDIPDTQKFDLDELNNYGLRISFKLSLAIPKFIKIDENFIEEIKQYTEIDKDNLYYLGQITGQIRYLVEEMDIKDLRELSSKL